MCSVVKHGRVSIFCDQMLSAVTFYEKGGGLISIVGIFSSEYGNNFYN